MKISVPVREPLPRLESISDMTTFGRRPRIYLIEDSPIIRARLTELLEAAGAAVIGHADTASAAIADIAALHPDAVTIDISLRKGSGFDVLEAIVVGSEANPPVRIVLTNYASDAYRDAARELGADHFFDKARQIPELLGVVSCLGDPRGGS